MDGKRKPGNPGFGTIWKNEPEGTEPMDTPLNMRMSRQQKEKLKLLAQQHGMDISRYVRYLIDSIPLQT